MAGEGQGVMKTWWKVTYADGTSVWIQAATADGAVLTARLMAWSVTGTWPEARATAARARGED